MCSLPEDGPFFVQIESFLVEVSRDAVGKLLREVWDDGADLIFHPRQNGEGWVCVIWY